MDWSKKIALLVRDEKHYFVEQWSQFQIAESKAGKDAKAEAEILRISALYRDEIIRMKAKVIFIN